MKRIDERNWWITEAMMRYGGGFVKMLGHLYRLGDPSNQRIIKNAFPDYWGRYSELVEKTKEDVEREGGI